MLDDTPSFVHFLSRNGLFPVSPNFPRPTVTTRATHREERRRTRRSNTAIFFHRSRNRRNARHKFIIFPPSLVFISGLIAPFTWMPCVCPFPPSQFLSLASSFSFSPFLLKFFSLFRVCLWLFSGGVASQVDTHFVLFISFLQVGGQVGIGETPVRVCVCVCVCERVCILDYYSPPLRGY